MKKLLTTLTAFCMLFVLASCGGQPADTQPDAPAESTAPVQPVSGGVAAITVRDYGTIRVELDAAAAPATVENFVRLVGEGFYDGLTFHRIISGFMIQGGDPNGDGTGGSDQPIVGEFAQNGFDNPISHTRGTISMARTNDPDSASSQFFIMHEDNTYLDGAYAGFGHVIEGMEVVDAICEAVPVLDGNGTVAADQQPVIESIAME